MKNERLTFGHRIHGPVPSRPIAMAVVEEERQPFRFTHPETWDWGWGGLLIFSILLFFRPQGQIDALGRMHLSDLAAAVGLSAMIFLRVSNGFSATRLTAELVGMLTLGAVIVFTIPFSFWPGGSFAVFTGLFVKVLLIFILMVNTANSPKRVEKICRVIVLAFGLVSATAWIDYATGQNLVEGNRVAGPAGGFFGNPNDLALNLAAFLPLALIYLKRPDSSFLWRASCAVIAVLMLGAIVFTKSRSGMLGAMAMLAVYVAVTRSLTPRNIIIGILAGMMVLPALPATFWERMSSITDEEKDATGSRAERIELAKRAWNLFLEHPLTGVGAGQFKNYGGPGEQQDWRVTHNVVLEMAAELGVFGLGAFLFLIWRGFSAAWWTRGALSWIHRKRMRGKQPLDPEDGLTDKERVFLQTHGAAMVACMTGWLVCAMFASVAFNWTFYYLLGLSVCARDVVRGRAAAYARAKAAAEQAEVAA